MQRRSHETTSAWRRGLWLALLIAASVAFTLALACAMPFAALGAAAALTLSRRDALLLTGGAWLANQLVGFLALGYAWTGNALAWGAALGLVAALTTLAAQGTAHRLKGHGVIAIATVFLAAFVVYEGALYLVSVAGLGGMDAYAPAIVAWVLALNAVAFAGFLALHRLGAVLGFARPALYLAASGA